MRSKNFHIAIANGNSRFGICLSLSRGVRLLHAPGTRVEDSISKCFDLIDTQQPQYVVPVIPANAPRAA